METTDKDNMNNELAFLSKKILELNKKLIESEKAKSRFLSLVTNKLNNPMTVFLGIIPHLKIDESEENRIIFDLIYKEVLGLEFIIQNLVAAAEIESGNIDVSYALVNPIEIVDEALESLRYCIKEKNIKINITDKINKKIVTDPKKVNIILKNLISNGCQYGIENTIIEIILSLEGTMFVINVKNHGKEPKINYKPEIFTRFAKDAQGEHGLGIGLSVVRELSERLDGGIDYRAEEGTVTFTVKLLSDETLIDSQAYGSNEFLFESFDNAIEL